MGNKYSVTADPSRRRLWMPPPRRLEDESPPIEALSPLVMGDNRIVPDEMEVDDRFSGPAPNAYASTVQEQDEDPVMASKIIAAAETTFDEDDDDCAEVERSIFPLCCSPVEQLSNRMIDYLLIPCNCLQMEGFCSTR